MIYAGAGERSTNSAQSQSRCVCLTKSEIPVLPTGGPNLNLCSQLADAQDQSYVLAQH